MSKLNEMIRENFFYRHSLQKEMWDPLQLNYINIDRTYQITRQDDTYLSMRIYESYTITGYVTRYSETGLTINLKTGKKMDLDEILLLYMGRTFTSRELLESGAFRCLWFWRDNNEQDDSELEQIWLERVSGNTIDPCNKFYLTEEGLGLITHDVGYYTCVEADFADLLPALKSVSDNE